MTIYTRHPLCQLNLLNPNQGGVDTPLNPVSFTWGVDEGSAPAITATVVLPPPSLSLFSRLDPANRPFVFFYERIVRDPNPDGNALFGAALRVYARVRNEDNTVTLTLVSAEQDVIDYSPPATDTSNWARQGDVGQIISAVLTKVYGSSSLWQQTPAPSPGEQLTGAFPTYQAVTNLHPNPAVASLAGFTAYSSAGAAGASLFQSTNSPQGNAARATAVQTGLTTLDVRYPYSTTTGVQVESGKKYSALVWTRTNIANTTGQLYLQYTDANNNVLATRGVTFGFNGFTYVRARVTDTIGAPVGTVGVQLILRRLDPTQNSYVDGAAWMVVEGDGKDTDASTDLPAFNGDTLNGTNGYNYAWQSTANASPSARTPVLDRDPDTLTWKPGQSAWDFLRPILESVGGRLHSINGYFGTSGLGVVAGFRWVTSRFVPSGIAARYVEGANLYQITQTADLGATFSDDTPMFADAVVLRYSWTDTLGAQREAFDAFPTTGYVKPWYRELAEPFPGRGRAQGLYLRLRARATMLTLVVPYSPQVRPSTQVAVTSSQIGGSALGVVDAIEHDPYAGTSTIRTKNTISYPTNAWVTKTTPWSALAGSWAAQ